MIIPNLMVTDVTASVSFYRDIIGLDVMIYVDEQHNVYGDDDIGVVIPVFATLQWKNFQIMLQKKESLLQDVPEAVQNVSPLMTGTIYFRDLSPDEVLVRASADIIVKAPFEQWYGMRELYLRDPDGYIVCIGEKIGT